MINLGINSLRLIIKICEVLNMKIVDFYKKTECPTKVSYIKNESNKFILKKEIDSKDIMKGENFFKKFYIADYPDTNLLYSSEGSYFELDSYCSNFVLYVTLSQRSDGSVIDFYKLFVKDVKEDTHIKLGTIICKDKNLYKQGIESICLFKALNDSYALFIYKGYIDNIAILIDSEHNKLININTQLNFGDSLYEFDRKNCFLLGNQKFLFKTGSINISEKEQIKNSGHIYQNEQLFIFDVNDLIEDTHKNNKISYKLIEFRDEKGSLEVIEANKEFIIYIDIDFEKQETLIKRYNIYDNSIDTLFRLSKVLKDSFLYCNSKLYSYKKYGDELIINNLESNEEFIYKGIGISNICYFDNETLVIESLNIVQSEEAISSTWTVFIIDIVNNKVVEKYNSRRGKYVEEIDTLVLH